MAKNYCDTNVLTAFINKDRLHKTLGKFGSDKFRNSIKSESNMNENLSKNSDSCIISRDPLIRDIGRHEPSMGAVLTFSGLRNVEISNVNGIKRGREIFNKACSKIERDSSFHEKFCSNGRLKENRDLKYNDLNDIRHFGSAIELGVDDILSLHKCRSIQ